MISCQVEIPESSQLTFADTPAQKALTVGSEFTLDCKGDWPANYLPENTNDPEHPIQLPVFILGPEDADKIKLLDFRFTGKDSAKLTVTSYKPGLHQFKNIGLRSGESYVDLGALEWTVASVINPQEPPEGPYGPMGPFKMTIPLVYWLLLFTIIFILIFTVGSKIYRRSQRKKLMSDRRLQEAALLPAPQFFQAVRKLQREYGFFSGRAAAEGEIAEAIGKIQEAFQIYISRVFNVPALKWSPSVVVKDIGKQKILEPEVLQKIKKNLNELDRASKSKTKSDQKDAAQLLELVRAQVDQIESLKEGDR